MDKPLIVQTIQLALTPVFMLVAIGNIMNILSTRLARIVDRSRVLQQRTPRRRGRSTMRWCANCASSRAAFT
jgi:hypothetical protein